MSNPNCCRRRHPWAEPVAHRFDRSDPPDRAVGLLRSSAITRIGFDATPLLGQRTGIGRYVNALAESFGAGDSTGRAYTATAFSRAPTSELQDVLPASISVASRRIPGRALHTVWSHQDWPPVEALCGPVDLFHGTNFVLPPLKSARGVLTVLDLTFLRYPETVSAASARYAQLVPRGLARAAVVCTLTAALADEVAQQYGLDRGRIVVTPPGVDAQWFDAAPLTPPARQALGVPEHYFIAVGTVEPRKNLQLLVRAHRELCAADADTATLVIAGPAGWGPALGVTAADRIVLTGYLDTAVLQALVAGARCLAFPSLYEGFGLPPLEALACGVPVVVSDLPATREVLGTHASYVPAGDHDALVAALAQTMNLGDETAPSGGATPTAADERRAHARARTWARCTDAVQTAYDQALD